MPCGCTGPGGTLQIRDAGVLRVVMPIFAFRFKKLRLTGLSSCGQAMFTMVLVDHFVTSPWISVQNRVQAASRIAASLQNLEMALQQKRLDWVLGSASFQRAKVAAASVLAAQEVNVAADAARCGRVTESPWGWKAKLTHWNRAFEALKIILLAGLAQNFRERACESWATSALVSGCQLSGSAALEISSQTCSRPSCRGQMGPTSQKLPPGRKDSPVETDPPYLTMGYSGLALGLLTPEEMAL